MESAGRGGGGGACQTDEVKSGVGYKREVQLFLVFLFFILQNWVFNLKFVVLRRADLFSFRCQLSG